MDLNEIKELDQCKWPKCNNKISNLHVKKNGKLCHNHYDPLGERYNTKKDCKIYHLLNIERIFKNPEFEKELEIIKKNVAENEIIEKNIEKIKKFPLVDLPNTAQCVFFADLVGSGELDELGLRKLTTKDLIKFGFVSQYNNTYFLEASHIGLTKQDKKDIKYCPVFGCLILLYKPCCYISSNGGEMLQPLDTYVVAYPDVYAKYLEWIDSLRVYNKRLISVHEEQIDFHKILRKRYFPTYNFKNGDHLYDKLLELYKAEGIFKTTKNYSLENLLQKFHAN